jgi:hypothetical protein
VSLIASSGPAFENAGYTVKGRASSTELGLAIEGKFKNPTFARCAGRTWGTLKS